MPSAKDLMAEASGHPVTRRPPGATQRRSIASEPGAVEEIRRRALERKERESAQAQASPAPAPAPVKKPDAWELRKQKIRDQEEAEERRIAEEEREKREKKEAEERKER
jgi:hypothetical protein